MKNYILFLLIICCFFTTKAKVRITSALFLSSNNTVFTSQNKYIISKNYFLKEEINNDKEIKKAKRLKITGLVFTSLGVAGILTTTPFVVIYSSALGKGNLASAIVGVAGYTSSIACLATGIPMTIIGYKKSNKLKQSKPKEF